MVLARQSRTDRQTDRYIERQTDKQTDRQIDRETGKPIDRQTDRQRDRKTSQIHIHAHKCIHTFIYIHTKPTSFSPRQINIEPTLQKNVQTKLQICNLIHTYKTNIHACAQIFSHIQTREE